MKRQSKFLFMVIIIMLCFIAINLFLVQRYIRLVKNDAENINDYGIIRGSIQRYVKLEMSGAENQKIEDTINLLLEQYEDDKAPYINSIGDKWNAIREAAIKYRGNPSSENRELLLRASEDGWRITDQAVLLKQYIAENNITRLTLPLVFLAFGFVVGLALLYIVKRYVYDNLEKFALYDLLTDIYSRRYFFEYMNKEISRSHRKEYDFSIIMFDIDRFKKVNDTYGHAKGDHVLKIVAKIVKDTIRNTDILSRIGGEEFTIILPETKIEQATKMAERVRQAIEDHVFDTIGSITISLGVTSNKPDDNSDKMLKRVDSALYSAKNSGRNRVCVEK